ncbi:MAG: LLM class flavin-dependent oxidoreductase [Ilumatobacter sp.]|nr:LLM class flavin-dependent oxidoreductase [Ilumatobacter sp.]
MGLTFGATVCQLMPYATVRDDVVFADSLGLDHAWVIDQFEVPSDPSLSVLESWSLLGALAAETRQIRLGAMVTNIAMRNPGMLAKSILTIDDVSAGRVVAVVGSGHYESEARALGVDFPAPQQRIDRLREGAAILDQALRGETVTFAGDHFQLDHAAFQPQPVQKPRPPLWVAGQGRRSLSVGVDHADAVVCLGEHNAPTDVSLAAFRDRMELVDQLCIEAGRDPTTLRRCYFAGWAAEDIFGSADATADLIGRYAEAGATDFTFYLFNALVGPMRPSHESGRMADRDQLERTVTEVIPQFR